jgi:hypothetical protein
MIVGEGNGLGNPSFKLKIGSAFAINEKGRPLVLVFLFQKFSF